MASTVNLLSITNALASRGSDGLFFSTSDYNLDWEISENANYVVDDDRVASPTPTYYGMTVSPTNTEPVILELQNQTIVSSQANNTNLGFTANIKSKNQIIARCSLVEQTTSPGNAYRDTLNVPGSWTAFRSNYSAIITDGSLAETSDYTMHIQIIITGHNGDPFYITTCSLIDDFAFFKNSMIGVSQQRYIPTFYWDLDSLETNPSFPYFKLLDLMTYKTYETMQMYSEWFDFEVSELKSYDDPADRWTRSGLTDPKYAAEEAIPWLSQFTGTSTKNNLWAVPNQYDNEGVAISGGNPSELESWIDSDDVEDFKEWQLENAYYGYAAGTKEAIVESTKQLLTDTKTVAMSPDATVHQGTSPNTNGSNHVSYLTLASTASVLDDAYNGMTLTISGGTGSGQVRTIGDWPDSDRYAGSTRKANVTVDFTTAPDETSVYTIDSPWHVLVETLTSETPDSDAALEISQPILSALELAQPMGFTFGHLTADGMWLKLNSSGRGLLDQFPLK
tara:strand:+ start:2290 stop:3810 length:1521 start_codon:yes stop_codon:yes gene_type:complete